MALAFENINIPWFYLSHLIHNLEEWRLPVPSSRLVMIGTLVGIPITVLLHDTSDYWLPLITSYGSATSVLPSDAAAPPKTSSSWNIPIISWFLRRWKTDPQAKESHLRILRNAVIFTWFIATLCEPDPKEVPLDYVSDRVTSSDARSTINKAIHKTRQDEFIAASEVISDSAFDSIKAAQVRDSALRRRHAQEMRSGNQ